MPKQNKRVPFKEIKRTATGRWESILQAAGMSAEDLEHNSQGRPCPLCGGTDRFNVAKDFHETGGVFCRKCFSKSSNIKPGDGIATVAWFQRSTIDEAGQWIANHLGLSGDDTNDQPADDVITLVCRDKRMPRDAFLKFGATEAKRGRKQKPVARVPVYNHRGERHSHYDFAPGHKGWFDRGEGKSGMFFPGRLPEAGETWLLVEGCKDAAALVGMGYNAAGLPSSKMPPKFGRLFRGCHIVLVPDLDEVGQGGAVSSGGCLRSIAASVRIARLPGEAVETGGDDVRDVLRTPGGASKVREAIDDAEPWQPREGEPDKDGRPEVLLTLNYGWHVDQVTQHVGRLGWKSPWVPYKKRERLKVYQRGGQLVHVITEPNEKVLSGKVTMPAGSLRIRPLPTGQIPLRISDACQLVKEVEHDGDVERKAVPPPKWLIDGIASRGEYGDDVKALRGIISAPTIRPDGSILQRAGYDERTGLLYKPCGKFPRIPEKPSREDAMKAAGELLDVVKDFPFQEDADRSAWLAMVLSMIGRSAVDGCVPMFAITANVRGAGKSLLADAASIISLGRPAARKTYSTDDNETRKAITATAIEGLPAVLLDNIDRTIGGASLDAALTATTWSDRILGSSATTGELPLTTVWAATGNNLRFGSDIARRVLPIRLASPLESPEERTDVEHPDLLGFIAENRPRLAAAALTILRAYFVGGCPKQAGGTWGSFEPWSDLIRGAIVWTGMVDLLSTRTTAKADDASKNRVLGLIGGLLEVDSDGSGMTVRQIVDALNAEHDPNRYPVLREIVAELATNGGKIDGRKLGNHLRINRGRIANGWILDAKTVRGGVSAWFVKPAGGSGGSGGPDLSQGLGKNCVCTPEKGSNDIRHTQGSAGRPAEVGQPDQPDPPSQPCPKCGGRLVRLPDTPEVGGWLNLDCLDCGHVERTKVEAAAR
ncbi:primase-helicase zinc-binding domain-containing protein [Crateriforma conspicua]|uniref:Zinc-binding domain of primase-helicase n=1 Tax=Crateriforma conspicua TaxID=2527996 RepID=A0A5C5Y9H2_9PLAN|nr:primase-helicase zinc-binding domain-containing protein [Crateriforma conspicua]TWT70012.1 Zinc-binding domain of primase-helicase [Crateriforma conspicua]